MPMRTDRAQIAFSFIAYAAASLCLIFIHPANLWVAVVRVGLITLFSAVCIYALALLVHGSFSKRVVCVATFSPLTHQVIGLAATLLCVLLLMYSMYARVPCYTEHHGMPWWPKFINCQTRVIELVEGRAVAERFTPRIDPVEGVLAEDLQSCVGIGVARGVHELGAPPHASEDVPREVVVRRQRSLPSGRDRCVDAPSHARVDGVQILHLRARVGQGCA